MKKLLSKISSGVKNNQADIILAVGVILISLLSFASGYIVAKTYDREPLKFQNFENENSYHRSRDNGTISGLEIG